MCQKDIMEYLGIKKTKTVELMKVFSKHYLIFSRRDDKKDKRKNIFYISPELFFIGTHIKKEIKYYLDRMSKELDEVKEGVETENLEVMAKVDDSTIEISEEAIDEFIDCIIKCDVDGIV
jgi:DNA-binding transcriptional regulator GbsR (MarR family)